MRSQGNDTQSDVLLTKFEELGLAIERGIALLVFQTIVSPISPNEKMKNRGFSSEAISLKCDLRIL